MKAMECAGWVIWWWRRRCQAFLVDADAEGERPCLSSSRPWRCGPSCGGRSKTGHLRQRPRQQRPPGAQAQQNFLPEHAWLARQAPLDPNRSRHHQVAMLGRAEAVPHQKQGVRFGRPLDSAGVRFGRPCERSSHIAPKVTSGPLAGRHPRDGAARHL